MTEGPPHCLFCEWVSDGEAGVDAYVLSVLNISHYEIVKDGGVWPVHNCPECEVPAMVHGIEVVKDAFSGHSDIHDPYIEPEFVCFNCGYRGTRIELDQCGRCGGWTSSGMGFCDDCYAYAVVAD